jgi:hypothetical protein
MTKSEIEKELIINHKNYSCRELAKKLNVPYSTLRKIALRINIKFTARKNNSDIKKFKKLSPLSSYILGFLWADGSIGKRKGRPSNVATEITQKDAFYLEQAYNLCGIKYSKYERTRPGRSPQCSLTINDCSFTEFLIDVFDFDKKSQKLPNPKLFKYFDSFLLGFMDGDGYIGKRVEFSGSYNFDWGVLTAYLDSKGISDYRLRKYISPKTGHSLSSVRINVRGSKLLLDTLYKRPAFYLPRKFQAYNTFFVSSKERNPSSKIAK